MQLCRSCGTVDLSGLKTLDGKKLHDVYDAHTQSLTDLYTVP